MQVFKITEVFTGDLVSFIIMKLKD